MLHKIIRPDAKGRITLGHLAEGVSGFTVTETKDHKIILEPYSEVPSYEKWLFENKVAIDKISQGLKEAAKGEVSSKGSFAKFVKDDAE